MLQKIFGDYQELSASMIEKFLRDLPINNNVISSVSIVIFSGFGIIVVTSLITIRNNVVLKTHPHSILFKDIILFKTDSNKSLM